MRAIVLTGINQMQLRDVPKPDIQKDTDVLLKIEVVGICGSDLHYYETGRIGEQIVEYPFIIGHECSATVEAVGSSVDRVKVGDEVVGNVDIRKAVLRLHVKAVHHIRAADIVEVAGFDVQRLRPRVGRLEVQTLGKFAGEAHPQTVVVGVRGRGIPIEFTEVRVKQRII